MNSLSKINQPLLGSMIIILLVVAGLFLLDFGQLRRDSTEHTAEAYLAAILAGDKAAAMSLMRLEPLCSGAGMQEQVDLQIERFGSAQVRNIDISVHDLTGSVAYNPGTEGADIHFEYKQVGDHTWRLGEFGVVTFEHRDDEHGDLFRAICWLWTAN